MTNSTFVLTKSHLACVHNAQGDHLVSIEDGGDHTRSGNDFLIKMHRQNNGWF